jgi:hypothetical protein
MRWDTQILCWCNSLFVSALTFLCHWSGEGGKNSIALVRLMDISVIITLGGVQIPALREHAWLAVILSHMMIVIAPAAWMRGRPGTRAWERSRARATPASRQVVCAWQRGLVILHGLVALFLEVIMLAIILLFIGLAVLRVFIVATRTIVALIVSMTIVRLSVIVIV